MTLHIIDKKNWVIITEDWMSPIGFCKEYSMLPLQTLRTWIRDHRSELEEKGILIKLRNNKLLIHETKMVEWMQNSKNKEK